jgi:hypothetical protein
MSASRKSKRSRKSPRKSRKSASPRKSRKSHKASPARKARKSRKSRKSPRKSRKSPRKSKRSGKLGANDFYAVSLGRKITVKPSDITYKTSKNKRTGKKSCQAIATSKQCDHKLYKFVKC